MDMWTLNLEILLAECLVRLLSSQIGVCVSCVSVY